MIYEICFKIIWEWGVCLGCRWNRLAMRTGRRAHRRVPYQSVSVLAGAQNSPGENATFTIAWFKPERLKEIVL